MCPFKEAVSFHHILLTFLLQTNGETQSKFLVEHMDTETKGSFHNVKIISDFAGFQRYVTGYKARWAVYCSCHRLWTQPWQKKTGDMTYSQSGLMSSQMPFVLLFSSRWPHDWYGQNWYGAINETVASFCSFTVLSVIKVTLRNMT